jgi:hypothetical protein
MPAPYAQIGSVTLYHADCRDILPRPEAQTVITDPVWPGAEVPLEGRGHAYRLLQSALHLLPREAERLAIHLGCDTDPRFLDGVPERWDFFRVAWLEFPRKAPRGRLLHTSDVASDLRPSDLPVALGGGFAVETPDRYVFRLLDADLTTDEVVARIAFVPERLSEGGRLEDPPRAVRLVEGDTTLRLTLAWL